MGEPPEGLVRMYCSIQERRLVLVYWRTSLHMRRNQWHAWHCTNIWSYWLTKRSVVASADSVQLIYKSQPGLIKVSTRDYFHFLASVAKTDISKSAKHDWLVGEVVNSCDALKSSNHCIVQRIQNKEYYPDDEDRNGQGGFQPRLAVQLLKSWSLKAALERWRIKH